MMLCFLFSLPTVLISQGVFGYTLYFSLRHNSTVNSSFSLCGLLPKHKLYHTAYVFAVARLYLVSFPPGSASDGLLFCIYKGHPRADYKQLAYLSRIKLVQRETFNVLVK